MKNLPFLIFLLWSVIAFTQHIPKNPNKTDKNGFRQGKWSIWFNKDWKSVSNKDSIAYYRLITYKDDKPEGVVTDYYMNGKKQFEGQMLADRPEEVMEGTCSWYKEDGSKEVARTYQNGNQILQTYYNPDGTEEKAAEALLKAADFYKLGKYAEALPIYERYFNDMWNALKDDNESRREFLTIVMYCYKRTKQPEREAEVAAMLKELEASSPSKWTNLKQQGFELYESGKYDETLPIWKKAREEAEKEFGKNSAPHATACNDLAVLYEIQGLFDLAETLFIEAKSINEKVLGKAHPTYAHSCNSLGRLYKKRGFYEKAEPLYIESKNIREKVLGKNHPDYAESCNSLALLYEDQGLHNKAELLFIEAKNIREQVLGKNHPDFAVSMINLALLYGGQGFYEKAEPLMLEAKDIFAASLGVTHPYYADACNNLGYLFDKLGKYKKAELLYMEAKNIREQVFGKNHQQYANSCNNLAVLFSEQGLYDKAETLMTEAKNIYEKVLGKTHPTYAAILENLASFYFNQENYVKAEPLFIEAGQVYFSIIENQFILLSDKEKEAFFNTFQNKFTLINSFFVKRYTQKPGLIENLYNNLLFTKAFLFNAQNKIRSNILTSGDTQLISLYQDWQTKRDFLAKIYQIPLTELAKKGIEVKKSEEEVNNLEKQLSAQSQSFAKGNDKKRYTWQEIRKTLKPKEAAIEVIRLRWYDKKWTDTIYYAALIITPNARLPELVLMKNGNELENRYIAYYKNAIRSQTEDKISYTQFWKPIAEKLRTIAPDANRIYFSPDGVYNSINISTLLNPAKGKFLQEEISIQLLSNTKDLVTATPKPNPSKDASLFGYPDYGNKTQPDTVRSLYFDNKSIQTDSLKRFFENGKIPMLSGTEKEITELKKLFTQKNWKATTFMFALASENQLKALRNPRILHIATHGFFMKDVENTSQDRSFAGFDNQKVRENPLLRSGLLLAGSQQAFEGKVNSDEEDGILTAYEAMNLNLDNTELVVLSACETGLGEIKNGEGVYGLQRAFQTAGAKAVIMSLWRVNDNSTQEFMTLFYENWLKSGSKGQAFLQAQNILKAKYKKPYFWGAFVMVGE